MMPSLNSRDDLSSMIDRFFYSDDPKEVFPPEIVDRLGPRKAAEILVRRLERLEGYRHTLKENLVMTKELQRSILYVSIHSESLDKHFFDDDSRFCLLNGMHQSKTPTSGVFRDNSRFTAPNAHKHIDFYYTGRIQTEQILLKATLLQHQDYRSPYNFIFPIHGYLSISDNSSTFRLDQETYGNVTFVLSNQCKIRSTWCNTDSMYLLDQEDSGLRRYTFFSPRYLKTPAMSPYLEFQTFGGIDQHDIAEIWIPDDTSGIDVGRLKRIGKPIYSYSLFDYHLYEPNEFVRHKRIYNPNSWFKRPHCLGSF